MNLDKLPRIEAGKYVLAVSGGIDSMVLLDILSKTEGLELIIAHVDHGIRDDSSADVLLVANTAKKLDLKFETTRLEMGKGASEANARELRYTFLNKVSSENNADGIITAHHQDDVIETAIINLMRGTKYRGLSSLGSKTALIRPLLAFTKDEISKYAEEHSIEWREDSTNDDDVYFRNYVRRNVVAKMNDSTRQRFLEIIEKARNLNQKIDLELSDVFDGLSTDSEGEVSIERAWFTMLPQEARFEVIAEVIRKTSMDNLESKTIKYLDLQMRTAQAGTSHSIGTKNEMIVNNANVLVKAKTF